jgi:hypothetical protein
VREQLGCVFREIKSYICCNTLGVSIWSVKTHLTVCLSVLRNEVGIPGVYQMVQITEHAVRELS